MTKIIGRLNCVNRIGIFQSKNAVHNWSSVRCRPHQTFIQQMYQLESKFAELQV